MNDSILGSVNLILGLSEDDSTFDTDILTHINMTIATLEQIGVSVPEGFMVTGSDETWTDLIDDPKMLQFVKTYVYLKVRVAFDPPTGSVLEALKSLISELEWRITIRSDELLES